MADTDRPAGEDEAVTERDGRTHTRGSNPKNGPDFCRECSDEAMGWVTWPCGYVRATKEIAGPHLPSEGETDLDWWENRGGPE